MADQLSTDQLVDETAAQRRALVELLSGLSSEQWDEPSLCDGWRVREVVAHLTMPFRHSIPTVLKEVIRARGRFDAAADRLARRDTTEHSDDALLACLRDNIDHPWKPPGGGQLGALSHDVIHGLDITEALGLDPLSPAARIGLVLRSPKLAGAFKVDLDGLRLEATDTNVSLGTGPTTVSLPAKELLLVATARQRVPRGSR